MSTTARRLAPGTDAGLAASSLAVGKESRSLALLLFREQLWRYVCIHGLGHEFQAIDFSTWLIKQDPHPDPCDIDARATGGLFIGMVNAGVLEKIGYRSNGGDKDRNYNASPRAVYRVALLDYTRLGWLERHPDFDHRARPEPEPAPDTDAVAITDLGIDPDQLTMFAEESDA